MYDFNETHTVTEQLRGLMYDGTLRVCFELDSSDRGDGWKRELKESQEISSPGNLMNIGS